MQITQSQETNRQAYRAGEYSFRRIPRADERDGAVNVRDEFSFELVILHFQGYIELTAGLV